MRQQTRPAVADAAALAAAVTLPLAEAAAAVLAALAVARAEAAADEAPTAEAPARGDGACRHKCVSSGLGQFHICRNPQCSAWSSEGTDPRTRKIKFSSKLLQQTGYVAL